MKLDIQEMKPDARVWIYQCNAKLTDEQVLGLRKMLDEFVQQWAAHQRPLAAYGDIWHNRFLILMVDQRHNQASGCSIDESVAFVKSCERQFGINLFDRMIFFYKIDDQVKMASKNEFTKLYQDGIIHNETLVFDNLVNTKKDLEENWIKPLKDSWHKRFVPKTVV